MNVRLDEMESKSKRGEDIVQDMKEYDDLGLKLFKYAQRVAESDQAKQHALTNFIMSRPRESNYAPMLNNNLPIPRQQSNCRTVNISGVLQTQCE